MQTIVIVEDERVLREELSVLLQNAGYQVKCITEFQEVAKQLKEAKADLILLDINLPVVNGEVILQDFRKTSDVPVIMLTRADDYITKPYNPTILLLRISAVLKRGRKESQVVTYRDLEVSTVKGSLIRGEEEQVLTKNEMIIFHFLLEHTGEIVSRDDLMTALWDNEEYLNDNALSVNISRLRTKLADLGVDDAIETRKKQGYILK